MRQWFSVVVGCRRHLRTNVPDFYSWIVPSGIVAPAAAGTWNDNFGAAPADIVRVAGGVVTDLKLG